MSEPNSLPENFKSSFSLPQIEENDTKEDQDNSHNKSQPYSDTEYSVWDVKESFIEENVGSNQASSEIQRSTRRIYEQAVAHCIEEETPGI